jgi:hypothetical protein
VSTDAATYWRRRLIEQRESDANPELAKHIHQLTNPLDGFMGHKKTMTTTSGGGTDPEELEEYELDASCPRRWVEPLEQ